jgi:hypothetical protein
MSASNVLTRQVFRPEAPPTNYGGDKPRFNLRHAGNAEIGGAARDGRA